MLRLALPRCPSRRLIQSTLPNASLPKHVVRSVQVQCTPVCLCRVEDYLPNLAAEIATASLVISHAGAGSIFESLLYRVPLIVVPNPILMDNHQVELAKLMEDRNHAVRFSACFSDT